MNFHNDRIFFAAIEKLNQDYHSLVHLPSTDFLIVSAKTLSNSMFITRWTMELKGPIGSAYEGLKLVAYLTFPFNYPNYAPEVRMDWNILHPNVEPKTKRFMIHGLMSCTWRREYDVRRVMGLVMEALARPDNDFIVNKEAALLYPMKAAHKAMVMMRMDLVNNGHRNVLEELDSISK